MSRNGINYPAIVDLVTESDESLQLVLVETRSLTQHDAPALQEKLNNYLSYVLNGSFTAQYPAAQGKPTCIRVDLYSLPEPFIVEFLRKYAGTLISSGISLEANVNGKALS